MYCEQSILYVKDSVNPFSVLFNGNRLTPVCSEPDLGGPYSLVPKPSPSFPSLAVHLTVLQATGSWVRAWERG